MERGNNLRKRIRSGHIRREDVTRRLAELAFGKANDCVRLALEDASQGLRRTRVAHTWSEKVMAVG